MARTEPERELVRRILPVVPLVALVAFAMGWAIGGLGVGSSAAIAIVIVTANFVAFALSVAWAADISPSMIAIVTLGGYVVRLLIFTLILVGLNTLAWFSPVAFVLALVPSVIALLIVEARILSGRMQADLWSFDGARP